MVNLLTHLFLCKSFDVFPVGLFDAFVTYNFLNLLKAKFGLKYGVRNCTREEKTPSLA